MKKSFTREQRSAMILAILSLILITVVLQLWLLAATMNSYLGGDDSVIWPAALVSLVCFGMNARLLRVMASVEGQSKGEAGE
jgi:hypothetical protein